MAALRKSGGVGHEKIVPQVADENACCPCAKDESNVAAAHGGLSHGAGDLPQQA
jgi:hypothetical protein